MRRDELEARFRELRRTGDAAVRDELIEVLRPLALHIARRYRNRGADADDIRQVAMVGLVKAVDRFDPDQGAQFSSFGGATIEGEIKRHLRDHSWAVRVPRGTQEAFLRVVRARKELEQQLGRPATVDELADHTDLDVDAVLQALDAGEAYRATSIDAPAGGDDEGMARSGTLGETEQGFAATERSLFVDSLLDRLPERERTIIELRFFEDLTQSEIAERVGMSQMHVSRLLRRTIDRLAVLARS